MQHNTLGKLYNQISGSVQFELIFEMKLYGKKKKQRMRERKSLTARMGHEDKVMLGKDLGDRKPSFRHVGASSPLASHLDG